MGWNKLLILSTQPVIQIKAFKASIWSSDTFSFRVPPYIQFSGFLSSNQRRWMFIPSSLGSGSLEVRDVRCVYRKQARVSAAMKSSLTPCSHPYHSFLFPLFGELYIKDFWHRMRTLFPRIIFFSPLSQSRVDLELQEPRQGQEARSPDNTKSNLTVGGKKTLQVLNSTSQFHIACTVLSSLLGPWCVIIPNEN